jgi:hypothetical protein
LTEHDPQNTRLQLTRIFATYAIHLGLASGLWNARLIDGSQFALLLIFPAFIQCLARIVPQQKPAVLVLKGLIVLAALAFLNFVVAMPAIGMALITGLLFALKVEFPEPRPSDTSNAPTAR